MTDAYLIPARAATGEFRDRGSKFVAALAHVRNEEEALAVVEREQQRHHKCNHHCYAYRLGPGPDRYRANDDGEPSGTAGRPILGQIDKVGWSDMVIVVSRYFGGIKLGTSGLINAYREAARLAIQDSAPTEQPLTTRVELAFGYELMSPVMSALSTLNLEMSDQAFEETARVVLDLPRSTVPGTVRELKATVAGVYVGEVDEEFAVPGLVIGVGGDTDN